MATTLSPSEMKDFVRRHFEDFVNRQKPEVIRHNMTEDFLDHDGPGGKETGVEGDEEMMRNIYRIMPDLHIDIDEMIAEGDKVVCRNRWQGTNSQSGKRMEFHGFVEWRFEGNRIAERWATVTAPAEIR
jgi:predicted ester cyclase